jgi:hypothetical protein
MNAPEANEYPTFPAPPFDPFPEPQTIPRGWDLSELILDMPPAYQFTDTKGDYRVYVQNPL